MANFLFKVAILAFIGWVIYMILTGNMGDAKKATQNYQDVLIGDRYQKDK
jgi:hypothetical protein